MIRLEYGTGFATNLYVKPVELLVLRIFSRGSAVELGADLMWRPRQMTDLGSFPLWGISLVTCYVIYVVTLFSVFNTYLALMQLYTKRQQNLYSRLTVMLMTRVIHLLITLLCSPQGMLWSSLLHDHTDKNLVIGISTSHTICTHLCTRYVRDAANS